MVTEKMSTAWLALGGGLLGKPGHLRNLSPLEIWLCQGRTQEEWDRLRAEGRNEEEIYEHANRATGIQVAAGLLVMAALVELGDP